MLLSVLAELLGENWNDKAQEGWETAVKVLLTVAKARLEMLEPKQSE